MSGRRDNDRLGVRLVCWLWHGIDSSLERPPALEPVLSCNKFLRIAQLEARRKDFGIAQLPIARQNRPDLRRNGIVTVAMPAQNEFGLLLEVLDIGHGRATV